jgi:hypothetical protein
MNYIGVGMGRGGDEGWGFGEGGHRGGWVGGSSKFKVQNSKFKVQKRKFILNFELFILHFPILSMLRAGRYGNTHGQKADSANGEMHH